MYQHNKDFKKSRIEKTCSHEPFTTIICPLGSPFSYSLSFTQLISTHPSSSGIAFYRKPALTVNTHPYSLLPNLSLHVSIQNIQCQWCIVWSMSPLLECELLEDKVFDLFIFQCPVHYLTRSSRLFTLCQALF